MPPRRPTFDPKGTSLSRKRTADLLKTLRQARGQGQILKARIETEERNEQSRTRRKRH